jgi:translation initiation factor 2 alpha subunit (eIF-2alpha)
LSGSTQFKKQEWFNALANIAENNLETEAIRTSAIYAIARASIEGQKTMAKQALENISKSDNAKLAADAKKALGFIK